MPWALLHDWLMRCGVVNQAAFLRGNAVTVTSTVHIPREPGEGDTWSEMTGTRRKPVRYDVLPAIVIA